MSSTRRLQRLRQHHEDCATRYEEAIKEKNERKQLTTVKLVEMMNRKKNEEQEELRDCVTDDSSSGSSHDLDCEYVTSTSDSSEDENSCHKVNTEFMFKEQCDKLQDDRVHDTDYSADNEGEETSQITVKSCLKGEKQKGDKRHYCVYSKKTNKSKMARHPKGRHGDENEVALATWRSPPSKKRRLMSKGPHGKDNYSHSTKVLRKGKEPSKGKRSKRISEPAEDSDEEPDILTQKTSTSRPSHELRSTKKTEPSKGKRSKRISEPAQDADEEPDILTQKTSTSRPSHELRSTEKTGMDPQFLDQKTSHRRSWSYEEKAAVRRQLGRYITQQRVPGKEQCIKALDAEPVLRRRDWKDVKNQVHNSITSQKRKL